MHFFFIFTLYNSLVLISVNHYIIFFKKIKSLEMRKLDQIMFDRYSVAVSSPQQSTLMLRKASSQIKNLLIHMT